MDHNPPLPVLRALQSIQMTGSISKSAAALGITQSAISRSIINYENAIGLKLLRRELRPITLTEEGRLVATHAADIDKIFLALNERLSALKQGKEGVVRIGSFGPSASTQILPNLIGRFAKHHPGISVSILEGSDEDTRKELLNGNVDLAVLGDPVDDFNAIEIAADSLVALVREGSSLANTKSIAPEDLQDEPFIITLAGSEPAILDWFAASDIAPNIKHRVQQTHSILALVRAGMGAAIVTSLSLPKAISGVVVKPLDRVVQRRIYTMRQPVSASSNAVALFWKFLNQTDNTTTLPPIDR